MKKCRVFLWGIKLAWKIDSKMLGLWTIISIGLAVLPAIILNYNRNILAILSDFLITGNSSFHIVVEQILIMGILLTVSGLSTRLNDDFLYMTMYDSFYLGLEAEMMEASQKIDLTEFVKKEVGDNYFAAISRCGSLTDITSSGCSLLSKAVSLVSILIVACAISPIICTCAIIYILFVIWLNAALSEQVRTVWKDMRELLRKADYFEKLVQEGDTAKEVRVFRNIDMVKDEWEDVQDKIAIMELRRARGLMKINLGSKNGFYLFLIVVMFFSIYQLQSGGMGPDVLLVLYTLGISIADTVASIPNSYQRLDYGLYGLDIQKSFFEGTPAIKPEGEANKANTPLNPDCCFSANHLCFSFPNGEPVLNDVSLEIKKGETVSLVGVNGSGKTTLLKVLLGLYKPDTGTLRFMGRPYDEYKQGFLSQKIGTFFQDFILFHLTVQENVGLGCVEYMDDEEMILSALKRGGAMTLVSSWKNGIKQLLLKNVYKEGYMLSGGEGQRIAVARTHMSDKDILIFDEPASMLDPIAELEQFENIRHKLEGRTAILVSHRVGFARMADRILVLNHGKIEEEGSHEELMQRDGLYADLFCQQAQWYDTDRRE